MKRRLHGRSGSFRAFGGEGRAVRHVQYEQLQANIRTYEEDKPLNEEEMKTLLGIADKMLEKRLFRVQRATTA